jgi:ribosomal protein S2, bacterial type
MTISVSLEELIKAGAHYGHQSKRWNPKMAPYLYGVNKGVHIFDLIQTKAKLEQALDFLKQSSKQGKKIIFVGTKKQVKQKINEVANASDSFYVNERWLGGTLTNFEQIKRSTKKMVDMKSKREAGDYKAYTKKERLLIDREIERLERFFSGIVGIDRTPDVMIVVDVKNEKGAIKEAKAAGLTTIAIVDSNCDPTDADFVIPMNDDASNALDYVLGLMEKAIMEGKSTKGDKGTKSTKSEEAKAL